MDRIILMIMETQEVKLNTTHREQKARKIKQEVPTKHGGNTHDQIQTTGTQGCRE